MPVWERESLPLVFCGDALAWCPASASMQRSAPPQERPDTSCNGTQDGNVDVHQLRTCD